jgi:hypothetical protein
MILNLQINPSNPADRFLDGIERLCESFNRFAVAFFWYMKFIFVFILFVVGIFTFAKMRGLYRVEKTKLSKKDAQGDNLLRKPRLILGTLYICMGFGILFNYFTYFLIIILDPLPDRFLFDFVNFSGDIDQNAMNRIEDINAAKYPHERSIYYLIAIASLGAILDVVISIAYIINSGGQNHRKTLSQLMGGIILGMLAGWTTCLPLLL